MGVIRFFKLLFVAPLIARVRAPWRTKPTAIGMATMMPGAVCTLRPLVLQLPSASGSFELLFYPVANEGMENDASQFDLSCFEALGLRGCDGGDSLLE
jgi:hypothetical protein